VGVERETRLRAGFLHIVTGHKEGESKKELLDRNKLHVHRPNETSFGTITGATSRGKKRWEIPFLQKSGLIPEEKLKKTNERMGISSLRSVRAPKGEKVDGDTR